MGWPRLTSAVGIVIALALTRGADAAPAAPELEQEAEAHFKSGVIHYNLGRFEAALQAYTRAYELLPIPALLFNIGQCHRQLGDHERAIFFLEGYLQEAEDGTNRPLIDELIAESRAALEADRAAELQTRREEEQRRREAEAQLDRQRAAQAALAAALITAPQPPLAPSPPAAVTLDVPLYKRWWFWTAAAGATAAIVGGTVIALAARGEERAVLPSGSIGTFDRRGGTR